MIEEAISALKRGEFILLYDFDEREGETDFAIRADAVTPAHIRTMRKEGGGLICTAIHPESAKRLGLPFACDILTGAFSEKEGDIPYDRKNHSSFSIWVNHRDTFTGITDNDRSLTITRVAGIVRRSLNGGGGKFADEFRSPGHVALLRAAEKLLDQRCGQTELSVALAEMAGITPAVTICEMLDDESGNALSKKEAMLYAQQHGYVFIEGKDVLKRWKEKES
ncbi:MAG: 3,4-dihydroxy-2-butanone-4-phosphate synthase [Methanomicrobiaceae archaeon]|nr:3,4-dihydroxy-2-butanone-4-phosphate synthase [Methanomicrobiaceae archaeon]